MSQQKQRMKYTKPILEEVNLDPERKFNETLRIENGDLK